MSYLIENPKGTERVYTDSLEGYEDWKVLAEGSEAKPSECHDFADGVWTENATAVLEQAHEAVIGGQTKDDLIKTLAEEVEDLRVRMLTLEAYIGSL